MPRSADRGVPGRSSASHPAEGGAQAGSGGWAGVKTLARPSSYRRNSKLGGGWLLGTSGAAPWPTPPPLWPAGSFARTQRPPPSTGPSPKCNCAHRIQQEPPPPKAKFARESPAERGWWGGSGGWGGEQNHVGVTSPICGTKDFSFPSQEPGVGLGVMVSVQPRSPSNLGNPFQKHKSHPL